VPSAKHYRDRAAQIRRLIDAIRDPEMQTQLEVIAKEYEEMAASLERRAATKLDEN
jgi:hypothetical protein